MELYGELYYNCEQYRHVFKPRVFTMPTVFLQLRRHAYRITLYHNILYRWHCIVTYRIATFFITFMSMPIN